MKTKIYAGLLLIVWVLSFSGCATFVVYGQKSDKRLRMGQHQEFISEFEKESNYDQIDTKTLDELCKAFFEKKNYKRFAEVSDALLKRIENDPSNEILKGTTFTRRSIINIDLGDYTSSLQDAESAIRHLTGAPRKYNDLLIEAYAAAGLANALKGNRVVAENYVRKIEGLSSFMADAYVAKIRHTAMAKILMAVGDYEQAKKIMNAYDGNTIFEFFVGGLLLDYLNKPGKTDSYITIPKEYMLTKTYYESRDLQQAEIGYDKLLGNPNINNFGGIYFLVLHERGNIYREKGNSAAAIDLFKKSVDIIESQRSTINTETAKIGFAGDRQGVYYDLVAALVEAGQYGEAFEYSERGKARALVDMLASKKQFRSKKGDPTQIAALMDELDHAEMNAIISASKTSSDQNSTTRSIVVRKKGEIVQTDPELASLVTVTTPTASDIQQLLPADETLLEFYGSGDTLFAFIVNRVGVHGIKLEIKGLRQKVQVFRDHIVAPDSDRYKTAGQALFEKLIKPLEGMIDTKNLTIVPHGVLHYLPFNALYGKDGFLIDRYNIRILPSAGVMKFLRDRRESYSGNLLAFGNPDLGDPNFDLPGAQKETIAITNEDPKSKLFLRKQATETALKRYGGQFRYIHFATHGTFIAGKPLLSGLLMAGDGENDGTLTVGELYDISLPADLVTLSACETALGKVANGDDVIGFTRGFLYAGTRSIVSSLWKVDDKATSILMQEFYKNLKESDKRSALRSAQLKIKDTYNSHPYFWAAFQITGSVQ